MMVPIEIYYSDYSYKTQQEICCTHTHTQKLILPMKFLDQDVMKYTAHKNPYETVHNVQKIDKLNEKCSCSFLIVHFSPVTKCSHSGHLSTEAQHM